MAFSILHVEDAAYWREFVSGVLNSAHLAREWAHAATGAEAITQTDKLSPDIILLDLILPDCDGFSLASELQAARPTAKIILLTARSDEVTLFRASRPPFVGLLWKNASLGQMLAEALVKVGQGKHYYPPEVMVADRRLKSDREAFFKILTRAELDLLPDFGLGLSDEEIAAKVGGSPFTVRSHRRRIMAKLGLHRSVELTHWALARGFVVVSSGDKPALRPGINGVRWT